MNIQGFKKSFESVLARVLDRKMEEMCSLTSDTYALSLVKHAQKLVLTGGKRIRPYLAYVVHRVSSNKYRKSGEEKLLETLVGLELFHAFALAHDDIMDCGKTRHGIATANQRFGDAQAILLGDLLFNWASELLAPSKAQPIFATMVDEVILGQMLDVDAPRRNKVTNQFIQDKMRLKTASYTFIRPMQVGVSLSQIAGRERQNMMGFCERFGLPLGLAFQIQDDLLDLTASSKTLGKSSMNDVREGQKTEFTLHASRIARHRELLQGVQGKKLTGADRTRLKKMFEESGAIEHGTRMMEEYFEEAGRALECSGLIEKAQEPFWELLEYVRHREA